MGGTSASSGAPGERAGRSLDGGTPEQPCYRATAGVTPTWGAVRARPKIWPRPSRTPSLTTAQPLSCLPHVFFPALQLYSGIYLTYIYCYYLKFTGLYFTVAFKRQCFGILLPSFMATSFNQRREAAASFVYQSNSCISFHEKIQILTNTRWLLG